MSNKYLDEAGVKELLKLVKGYIDLKISGDSVSTKEYAYKGQTTTKYMLTINDPCNGDRSKIITNDQVESIIADTGLAGSDFSYLYINNTGSLFFYATNYINGINNWSFYLFQSMPNLEVIYVKNNYVGNHPFSDTEKDSIEYILTYHLPAKVVWL